MVQDELLYPIWSRWPVSRNICSFFNSISYDDYDVSSSSFQTVFYLHESHEVEILGCFQLAPKSFFIYSYIHKDFLHFVLISSETWHCTTYLSKMVLFPTFVTCFAICRAESLHEILFFHKSNRFSQFYEMLTCENSQLLHWLINPVVLIQFNLLQPLNNFVHLNYQPLLTELIEHFGWVLEWFLDFAEEQII